MRKPSIWALFGLAVLSGGLGCPSKSSNSPLGPSSPSSPTPTQPPVFFVSQRLNNDANLFSRFLGSSNVVTVTSLSSPAAALEPCYSVAVGRLAYCLTGSGTKVLVTCNVDGSQPATLSGTAAYLPADPTWSPDGTHIAFSSTVGIVKVTTSGSSPVTLSANGSGPSWSPDGSKIAFSNGGHLYTMSASDGSGATDLSAGSLGSVTGVSDIYPAWSPDGAHIAFSSNRNAASTGTQAYNQLFLMAANGSGVTEVTVTSSTAGQSKDAGEVRWSPDGIHLLYSAIVNGSLAPGIFQVGTDGTGETPFLVDSTPNQIVGDVY